MEAAKGSPGIFDKALRESDDWLKEISSRLGLKNRGKAYRILEGVLQGVRDRLDLDSALQFGEHLPLIFKGVYWEGWHPEEHQQRLREAEDFFVQIQRLVERNSKIDAKRAAEAVFYVLAAKVQDKDIEGIYRLLPDGLSALWKEILVRQWTL